MPAAGHLSPSSQARDWQNAAVSWVPGPCLLSSLNHRLSAVHSMREYRRADVGPQPRRAGSATTLSRTDTSPLGDLALQRSHVDHEPIFDIGSLHPLERVIDVLDCNCFGFGQDVLCGAE